MKNIMSFSDLEQWVKSHYGMKYSLIYNDDSGYILMFDNGDTYEWRYTDMQQLYKPYEITINGVIVYRGQERKTA